SLAMVAPRPADHNLKAAGSNPAPATNPSSLKIKMLLVEQPARRAIDSLDRLLIRLASSGS
ncbi:hypothetical protein, partial [Rhizobium leguminosarum]|uniref:hypothetical protein n=1 Tax=Rhizobium leguminosarum TaxID=384 RepID=UPI003F9DFD7A